MERLLQLQLHSQRQQRQFLDVGQRRPIQNQLTLHQQ